MGLAGSLSATAVLTCGFNGGPLQASPNCFTAASVSSPGFSFGESLDWANAYGSANRDVNPNTIYNVQNNGPWGAITSGGLGVQTQMGPGYTGTQASLERIDNFGQVFVGGVWQNPVFAPGYDNWNHFAGMFDAPPDPGAGSPGDHLLFTNAGQGPLQIDFSHGITGVLLRVSGKTSGGLNATIMAFDHVTFPNDAAPPIATYTINAPNASGVCQSLGLDPPQPCNAAPWVGFEGLQGRIVSIVISTTDSRGMFIDTLYLDETPPPPPGVPEPGTAGLVAIAFSGLYFTVRGRRGLR